MSSICMSNSIQIGFNLACGLDVGKFDLQFCTRMSRDGMQMEIRWYVCEMSLIRKSFIRYTLCCTESMRLSCYDRLNVPNVHSMTNA